MLYPDIVIDEITRPSRDGGRDAIGRYRLGPSGDPVYMDFALEAKCFSPGIAGLPTTTVGVKHTARLISRLRHRQFGILVTTSVIAPQAYEELRRDNHPVILLSGGDIVNILIGKGKNSTETLFTWLTANFPLN